MRRVSMKNGTGDKMFDNPAGECIISMSSGWGATPQPAVATEISSGNFWPHANLDKTRFVSKFCLIKICMQGRFSEKIALAKPASLQWGQNLWNTSADRTDGMIEDRLWFFHMPYYFSNIDPEDRFALRGFFLGIKLKQIFLEKIWNSIRSQRY